MKVSMLPAMSELIDLWIPSHREPVRVGSKISHFLAPVAKLFHSRLRLYL